MKLAEVLILRADCQKRIAQLKSRLLVNAKVQEGDAPAETPQELIAELNKNIKLLFGSREQLAIFNTCPSQFLHGDDIETRE